MTEQAKPVQVKLNKDGLVGGTILSQSDLIKYKAAKRQAAKK